MDSASPLISYLIIAIAPIWITIPLAVGNPTLQAVMTLISTAAPMVAALLVTAVAEGKPGLRALRDRIFRWRVPPLNYVAALGLPVVCVLAPILIATLVSPSAYQPAPITTANQAVLSAVLVFAFLEEIGWTGFALPRLLKRTSALNAALLLGLLHGVWHLPLWVFNDVPYSAIAGIVFTMAFRVCMVWLGKHTGGSVIIAALFHAAVNASNSLTIAGVKPEYLNWVLPGGFVVAAVVIVALTGTDLTRKASL